MAAALERCFQPYAHDLQRLFLGDRALAQGKAIAVVVRAIPHRDLLIPAKTASNALHPIRHDGFTVAGAAQHDAVEVSGDDVAGPAGSAADGVVLGAAGDFDALTNFTADPGDMVIGGSVTANGSIIVGNAGGDIYIDGTADIVANADDLGTTDEVYIYTDSQIVSATGSSIRVGTGSVPSGRISRENPLTLRSARAGWSATVASESMEAERATAMRS